MSEPLPDVYGSNAAEWRTRALKAEAERDAAERAAERAEADLAAMTGFRDECERQYQTAIHAQGQAEADLATAEDERDDANARLHQCRADLAELNRQTVALSTENRNLRDALADEKRRRAGLRAGVAALADEWQSSDIRALLDTATEEKP